LQASGLVIEDTVTAFTGITGDAGTDIITATGSAFANGQKVRFTALTGGSGLNTTTNYFVINVSGATFQLSTTDGGSASLFTTNITAGTLLTGHAVQTHVQISNAASDTNSALVLTPKGTGAFVLGAPANAGASTGGNARGERAIDLSLSRDTAAKVASGNDSVCLGNNTTASGVGSVALGQNASSTTNYGVSIGYAAASSVGYSSALGIYAAGNRPNMLGFIALNLSGATQSICAGLYNKTTTNSAVELFGDVNASTRFTITSGKVMVMLIQIVGVKSDGSAVANYVRQYAIKNVGGTTSEVYAPVTIGTDNAAGTSILIEPNDTNDAIKISCTGITSEVWRWSARIDGVELSYGT
jgi:hypothetical protein